MIHILLPVFLLFFNWNPDGSYFRINQAGYLPGDNKTAFFFHPESLSGMAELVDTASGRTVFQARLVKVREGIWQKDRHVYRVDFGAFSGEGTFYLRSGDTRSAAFPISGNAYRGFTEDLLGFMRQQRCGYNPFLDMVCHPQDGRSFYGPVPDSTYLDVRGGWHDAGDQLKYLITSSFATGSMITAWILNPDAFADHTNALGQERPNAVPDILDEVRWGLEWLIKCHPRPDILVHQVADDRDHSGWKWPDRDSSDYGWGPNSYRAAYIADGKPQGLNRYQSQATGLANLAGRSAAALALGYQAWRSLDAEDPFGVLCLEKAKSLYALGRSMEGYQQGNSYGAPYRYNEDTWADDMEWGAAALYAATGETDYLEQARHYARMAGTTSWMEYDTADHYRFYPFINLGHAALYPHVDKAFQDTLAGYYRAGIEACARRAEGNMYRVGVPFIWCSNNLVTALVSQIILYEKMTGDMRYHDLMTAHRDWLLGRNPWGTSMFTGIPRNGEYPLDVHTSVYVLTGEMVPGGLVDGPVRTSIFRQLRGLTLLDPDEFAAFQNDVVVYHDDIGDYSTNEPTMDGTAGSILMMAYLAGY